MAHSHSGAESDAEPQRRRLVAAIAIIGGFLLIELVGALLTGSLALFADAGHAFSDVVGLVIALVAAVVALRPATDRVTFGYRRAEVFGALINGLILVVVAVIVTVEAIGRIIQPDSGHVLALPMLVVAALGFVANAAAAIILRQGAAASINMRGAYLEVLGDLLGTVAVMLAAGVILLTGFQVADAVASLVIAAMILPRAFILLKDVVRVLAQAVPAETDVASIREHILATPGVTGVHDVHVWAITSGSPVFTAHVVAEPAVFVNGAEGRLLDDLSECLSDHFDVAHSTFQLEPAEHAEHEDRQHK